MADFTTQLTPSYACVREPGPAQDEKDVLIDTLTTQLGNALLENRRLSNLLAAFQAGFR